MKLFAVRLLATAMINNVPVSPAEGIQMVSKEDRDRLIENKQAEDADADIDGADDAPFDPSPFSFEVKPGGRYTINGPGLEEPEKIQGKAKMEARVAALRAALPDDDLDDQDEDALRATAEAEEVEIEGDANKPTIVAAIRKARADKA